MEAALWTEKYRPKNLDEIQDQEEIVSRLKEFVRSGTMPHCLFAGPPGTGKTTAALCLAHDLFGTRTGHELNREPPSSCRSLEDQRRGSEASYRSLRTL